MNKRIRELSDIAYKNHLARNPNSSFGRRTDYDKEFAELIVRECMDLVKDCYAEPESGQSLYKTACASTMIEEHFGVEE